MTKKDLSLTISSVKDCDRTGDGNIKAEAKQRILKSIAYHLKNNGRANISEMAVALGLTRQTTKNFVGEILEEWHQEQKESQNCQILIQSKWLENIIDDISQNPETYDKGKIAVVNLKSALFGKLNALQKLDQKIGATEINFYVTKNSNIKELPIQNDSENSNKIIS